MGGGDCSTIGNVRLSYGSALEIGLVKGRASQSTTTLYIFLVKERCRGACGFCPQPLGIRDRISRVEWIEFSLPKVLERLDRNKGIQRVCIQCAEEPGISDDAAALAEAISSTGLPISVSTSPIPKDEMVRLRRAGVDILTIPIDCANRELIRRVKGKDLEDVLCALRDAVEVFGLGKVGTHIIIGLGESEKEAVELIQYTFNMGVIPSLFAFTPIRGTPLEGRPRPTIMSYRRIQLARHLIVEMGAVSAEFEFGDEGRITGIRCDKSALERAITDWRAFTVRGCPGCNRPYYNEGPRGPFYNCPSEEEGRKAAKEVMWCGQDKGD
ncbi:MAG: radical SAM protein [Candidatus Verstraetearchaeota archaeon]|nr:radical SAM protein [Candidatus Verstraetearchaeota archaeon]